MQDKNPPQKSQKKRLENPSKSLESQNHISNINASKNTPGIGHSKNYLFLKGVKTNNLKNLTLQLPLKKLTVVTGVSGSGKSSLAFDTLYAEGYRRYVESLSTYIRQFLEKIPKPDVELVQNIPPAIALEQKNHVNNSRTTVATLSEVYDYFRLLFAKIGKIYCYNCGDLVQKDNPLIVSKLIEEKFSPEQTRFYVLSPIQLKEAKSWADVQKALLANGFERVVVRTTLKSKETISITSLSELTAPVKEKSKLYLVIDRMSAPEKPKKDQRLQDALHQGFEHGLGKISLGVPAENDQWTFYDFSEKLRCEKCHIDYQNPEPQHFSFNSPLGACPSCSGFGFTLELDEGLVVPDPRRTIRDGAIDPLAKPASSDWFDDLLKFCSKHKINPGKRYEDLTENEKNLIWNGDGAKKGFPGIHGCFEELKRWKYKLHVRVFIRRYQSQKLCLSCLGSRLKKEISSIRVGTQSTKSLAELLNMSIADAFDFFNSSPFANSEVLIAKDILHQISGRIEFLNEVGVGYLTLNRLAKTLSGGECQRINLATQLGNMLCDTLYVLDEPSIGLHAADTEKLIQLVQKLKAHGNTVVVVEHDLDFIKSADHLIELGPHAGHRGGEVIVNLPYSDALKEKGCLTAQYINGNFYIPKRAFRREPGKNSIKITGACENNLKSVDVEIPLNLFSVVTGLSGSGKSTLIHKTIYNAIAKIFHKDNLDVGKFHRIYGLEHIRNVVLLDQKPIGKSSRSNPATYLKIWDDVRKIYANQSLSIRRGYAPQHFSFNVDGGRCPICKGEGEVVMDMHFMSDIRLPCEECGGKKFKKTVLDVEFKGKNVFELLNTTIDECIDLFRSYHSVMNKLSVLKKVGLGYLELGQSSNTLSGGECQRLKIASTLLNQDDSGILYIFDEPTTGLHIDDIKKLLSVIQDLVDEKNTVVVIEHNLELIAQSDWIIDLGPGGGEQGGNIVFSGPPEGIINVEKSITGRFLRPLLLDGKTDKKSPEQSSERSKSDHIA